MWRGGLRLSGLALLVSVLDSIATGGQSFSSQIPRFASDTPWWDTSWCKWAVEIAFVAASALFGMRHLNDPYG